MDRQHDGFVVRTYARFPLRTSMLYMGKDFAGQGVIRELSRVGCRILGTYPVTLGDTLTLRISHPSDPDPLLIKRVGVRWVKGFEFGAAFAPLEEAVLDRLHQMLNDVLESGSYGEWASAS